MEKEKVLRPFPRGMNKVLDHEKTGMSNLANGYLKQKEQYAR
jgi:hypothetical protein